MEDNISEITKLKSHIKHILSLYEAKNEDVIDLSFRNKILQKEIEQKNKTINELENKSKLLKIAKTISITEDDKSEVKDKINKIVREIDKSIGLLNE